MRLLFVIFLLYVVFVSAAPQSKLQFGNNENNKQVVEEVVVESVLHIKSQSGNRQARTDARTNLQDGARVAETKIY
ncbi:uncharacterized protein LOC125064066 [Vanessa atalanta]|uniref:uncharacterized protein LOC125064066 n=1 Tax=Vanessa atalanta TaxID=42275 RepID=UPI001FCCD37A|nr:uncharacterized protein LOC125064066 [Vanessa atalanta]